jgi:putative addiction module CopG family antidote
MATQLNITLPEELAAFVRARVASGQYASESEVIQDGIEELIDRERPLEKWLRTEVVAAYDAMEADPARGRSIEDVQETLAGEHRRATSDE